VTPRPLVLDGPAIPHDGLHLIVAGKAYFVMPATLRDWIADEPGSPTDEETERTARFVSRMIAMARAIRAGEAA